MSIKLFFFILLIPVFGVRAQNHELQYRGDFGIPTQSLKPIGLFYTNTVNNNQISNELLYRDAKFLSCQNNTFSYKYQVWQKLKLYLVGSFDYSSYKAVLPLYGLHGFATNIDINYKRLGLSVGFAKQIHFYESKVILELGYNIVRRMPLKRVQNRSVEITNTERDFIKYDYNLELKYDGIPNYYSSLGLFDEKYFDGYFLHSELCVNVKFALRKKLYFNFGLSFEPRVYFFYRNQYHIYNYDNGNLTPSTIQSDNDFNSNVPNNTLSSFLKMNVGVSYKF